MASDILITPNKGSAVNNAKIEFTGATSESSTMRIEVLTNGALSFIGSSGTAGIGIDGSIAGTFGSYSSYLTMGSLVANDPGASYYAFGHRIGGTLGISQGVSIGSGGAAAPSNGLLVGGNVGIGTTSAGAKLHIKQGGDFDGSGGSLLHIGTSVITYTSDLGVMVSVSDATTAAPQKAGVVLYNNDATAGGWSPMLLFSKKESGASPYQATMAGIAAKSPLGTGNGDSWIDGELHFYTAGAATTGLAARMVIDKNGNVGIGATAPSTVLDVDINRASQTDGIRIKNSNTGGYGHELNFNLYGYAGSTVGSFDVLSMRTQYNGTTGYVTFLTKAQPQSTAVQSLFLQGDGSVGIGTSVFSVYSNLVGIQKDQSAPTRLLVNNQTNNGSSSSELVVAAYGNSWVMGVGSSAKNSNALTWALDATAGTPSVKMTLNSSAGDLLLASTTAGSSNVGALVVQGGISAGNTGAASYIGGNLTAAGAITALGLTVSSTGSTQPVIDGGSSSGFPILEIKNSGAGGQRWLIENGRTAQSLGFYNATQTGSVLLLGPTGNVTVSGTGTHTFGTTNTVTMAAGVLTTTGAATFAGAVGAPSLTSPASTNLTLGTTTGGTSVTLQSANNSAVYIDTGSFGNTLNLTSSSTNNTGLAIANTDTGGTNWALLSNGSGANGGGAAGDLLFYQGAMRARFKKTSGDLILESTTAGSSGVGALVVQGGISAGNTGAASYFGGTETYFQGSTGNTNLISTRAGTSNGATFQYKTGEYLKWYHGLRGLVNDNFYIHNQSADVSVLILDVATNAATFVGAVTAAGTGAFGGSGSLGSTYLSRLSVFTAGAGNFSVGGQTNTNNTVVARMTAYNASNANSVNDAATAFMGITSIESVVKTATSNAGGDSGGDLVFLTKGDGGALTERMRLLSTGAATFAGDVTANGAIKAKDGGNAYAPFQADASAIGGGKIWTISSNASGSPIGTAGGLSIRNSTDGATVANFVNTGLDITGALSTTGAATFAGAVITGGRIDVTGGVSGGALTTSHGQIGGTANGLELIGQGVTNDVTIYNKNGSQVFAVPTGTVNLVFNNSAVSGISTLSATGAVTASAGGLSGLIVGSTAANNGATIQLLGRSSGYNNWMLATSFYVANGNVGLVPSTTVGGSTFSTPVFELTPTGAATFAGAVTSTGGLVANSFIQALGSSYMNMVGGDHYRFYNNSDSASYTFDVGSSAGYVTSLILGARSSGVGTDAITLKVRSATVATFNSTAATFAGAVTVSGTGTFSGSGGIVLNGATKVIYFGNPSADYLFFDGSNLITRLGSADRLTISSTGATFTGAVSDSIGDIRILPQNSRSAAYTTVLSDSGKHILHPSADTTARTITIDSNANVAYAIGTAITFINQNAAGVLTIAITTDTMRLAGEGTTGNRTLAANGVATAVKITSTEWIISGIGLT